MHARTASVPSRLDAWSLHCFICRYMCQRGVINFVAASAYTSCCSRCLETRINVIRCKQIAGLNSQQLFPTLRGGTKPEYHASRAAWCHQLKHTHSTSLYGGGVFAKGRTKAPNFRPNFLRLTSHTNWISRLCRISYSIVPLRMSPADDKAYLSCHSNV